MTTSDLRFIIVDNRSFYVEQLRQILLRLGHDPAAIWPPENTTFTDWDNVLTHLVRLEGGGEFDPRRHCCVLFLDLALDAKEKTFAEGVARITRHSTTTLDSFAKIVFTLYPTRAGDLNDKVDAILDKKDIESGEVRAAALAVRRAISRATKAWESRTRRQAPLFAAKPWHLKDSPSARRADAGLGADIIAELVDQEAGGWSGVTVSALGGGYSGSYLLKIDGQENGAPRSVMCKVARDKRILDAEIQCWRRAVATYEAFVGLIPPFASTEIKTVGAEREAWYIVQSSVPGLTLEASVLSLGDSPQVPMARLQTTYGGLFDRLTAMSQQSIRSGLQTEDVPSHFRFTAADVARFEASLNPLLSLYNACEDKKYTRREPLVKTAPELLGLVKEWPSRLVIAGLAMLPCYEQHGDLNPRNILITETAGPQLIDFARFAHWPVAYDTVRFELQLSLRLFDAVGLADAFPEGIAKWDSIWLKSTGGITDVPSSPQDNSCEVDSGEWLLQMTGTWRDEIRRTCAATDPGIDVNRVTEVCRCFDALRMCSYQDATWFKRLWYLLIACRSAGAAGLIST
jgi:hypothetical protein